MDPTLIVLVSFVIFIGLAYRMGYRQSIAVLDKKIASIHKTLDDAANAKESATQALYEERRRHEEILEEIELIAKRTEEQTLILRQQALQDINDMISTRQQAAENMIKRIHSSAIQSIQDEATTKTIATFEALVRRKFSPAQQQALNDMAIAQISTQLTKRRTPTVQKPKRRISKRSAAR
jgi:F0F1-type ATP synthase membrane subunit b/b'